MNIKLLKFTNGEEIVADVKYNPFEDVSAVATVEFTNPIRVVIMPPSTPTGKPSVGFADWIPYVKVKTFKIDKSQFLFVQDPVKEFVDQYHAIFSPIAMPSKPKLILES